MECVTGGRPSTDRGTLRRAERRPTALFAALVLGVLAILAPDPGAPGPLAAPADATIVAGAPDSLYQRVLGPRLREALFPDFDTALTTEEDQAAALRRVAADPAVMAFSQRDVYQNFVRDNPAVAGTLEFYGRMPACLYVVARKGGVVERYADLADPSIGDGLTLDVGSAAGEAAVSFAALAAADPALTRVRLEHRGGVRALSRVASGQIDGALVVASPGVADAIMDMAAGDRALWVIPIAERDIFRDGRAPGFAYAFRRVAVGSGGWFGLGPEVETICTDYGVVVNAGANPRLLEATAAAALGDALGPAPASVWSMADRVLRCIVETATATFAFVRALAASLLGSVLGS